MLKKWRENMAMGYTFALIVILILAFLVIPARPTGMKIDKLPGNEDIIVMATDAPDYIHTYRPGNREVRLYPSDERMNFMQVDRAGKRVFVSTKNGWLNIFRPGKFWGGMVRHKLGDVLQGVALSGDEKFVAVGLGSSEDYNSRDVGIYRVEDLEDRTIDEVPKLAVIPIKGDIQAIYSNPDPKVNRGYILSSQDDKIAVFDFSTGNRLPFIEVGNSLAFFRCSPDGKLGYGSVNARRTLAVMDLTPGRERTIKHIPLPTAPYYLAFNADGSRLYAGSRQKGEVYVIDTKTNELQTTYVLKSQFAGANLTAELIGVSTDEKYLYVIPTYKYILVYGIDNDGTPLVVKQYKQFTKPPNYMEVIRPQKKK